MKLLDMQKLFDKIDFKKLPNSFVIKCNHGCKWHYIIKNKDEFLKNERLFYLVKRNIECWIEQEYWCWNGFEIQYRGINHKLIIEPYMVNESDEMSPQIQIYCFNGLPKFIVKLHNTREVSIYDGNLCITEDVANTNERNLNIEADDIIKQTFDLSIKLAKEFNFVRVDWMIYENKVYFEELTFTPYSGFRNFKDKKYDFRFGNWLKF